MTDTREHVHSIFLVRHGQTSYNAQHRFQGQIDIPLNEIGRWQVKQTAAELTRLYVGSNGDNTFDVQAGNTVDFGAQSNVAINGDGERVESFASASSPASASSAPPSSSCAVQGELGQSQGSQRRQIVLTSTLSRAQETAHTFADPLGLDVHIDPGVAERNFGDWEGMSMSEVREQFPDDFASWQRFEGGELRHGAETKEAVGLRGLAAINDWAYQAGKDTDLFIFSHGAWINQTLQTVLGMTTIYPDFASLVSMRNAFWVKLSSLDLPDGSVRWRLEEYEHGPVAAYITDWNNPDLASV